MSKEKKEQPSQLVEAKKEVDANKEMAEGLQSLLEKHNCSIEGQMEIHDGKLLSGVLYKPCMKMGEKEEDAKNRAGKAKEEVEESLKKHGHKLDVFAVLDGGGNRFGFKFVKLEEEKK